MTRSDWSDEKLVLAALAGLLKKHGVEPSDEWLSVHALHALYMGFEYVVVIAYPPAKAVLWKELDLVTRQLESVKSGVGVWVLSEEEAKMLRERNLPAK